MEKENFIIVNGVTDESHTLLIKVTKHHILYMVNMPEIVLPLDKHLDI